MKKLILTLALLSLSSCAIEYSASAVQYDDLYVRRHYDWNTNNYAWYQYRRSYVYPSPYTGFYPYERIVVAPIVVVPKSNDHQYGKRPSRESLPNRAPSTVSPRRGRN